MNTRPTTRRTPKRRNTASNPVAGSSWARVVDPDWVVSVLPLAVAPERGLIVVFVPVLLAGVLVLVVPVATATFGLEGALNSGSPEENVPVVNSRIASTPALIVSLVRDIAVLTVRMYAVFAERSLRRLTCTDLSPR